MNEKTQKAIQQLAEIDEIILADTTKRQQGDPEAEYNFRSLVNQKGGLIDTVKTETGKTPYWTKDGYQLR